MPCGVRSNTKQLVILSAKRERIRISPLKGKRIAAGLKPLAMTRRGGETDCRTPYGGLACRLGRCFCFAEVSTGHPHRNDKIIKLFNFALRIPNSALLFKFFVKILKQPYCGDKSKLKINVFKPCFPIRYFAEKFFLLFGVGEILV